MAHERGALAAHPAPGRGRARTPGPGAARVRGIVLRGGLRAVRRGALAARRRRRRRSAHPLARRRRRARKADRFAPGDIAAGRYRIKRPASGVAAWARSTRRTTRNSASPSRSRRCARARGHGASLEALKLEGLLARAVWHPNVCRVYELVRHDEDGASFWCLAMERLHGPTLAERLREEGQFPLARALHIAEGIGAGLGAAHRAGIVHRDLKPANVVLVVRDGDEHAVVTDFGTGSSGREARAEHSRRGRRHAGVHGSRATSRGGRRSGRGHLRPRARPARDRDGDAALRRTDQPKGSTRAGRR